MASVTLPSPEWVSVENDCGVRKGEMPFIMVGEETGRSNVWPFPAFPNPLNTGRKQPVFNPNNHEDAPL